VFPKLFEELADHTTLNKILADNKIFKNNLADHEKEICNSIIDNFT
jgi:hypothetical protein